MDKKTVAVVIPTQKTSLTSDDKISLKHLHHFLSQFNKFLVIPQKTNSKNLNPESLKSLKTIKFPNHYFLNTGAYNQLMLSPRFYEKFADYKYILIYQLDALVFSKDLLIWCSKNYDYLGAPSFFSLIGKFTHKRGWPSYVLNGGISLRKVSTFIKVLEKAGGKASTYPFNEDGFWSFEAPKYLNDYRLPDFKTAISFAFEKNPRRCFKLNHNRLPFGVHAWERYDRNFWLPYTIRH